MIHLATSRAFLDGRVHPDDALLIAELESRGHDVRMLAWDGSLETPLPGELVLIRTTWDYYRRREAFIAWCERCEGRGLILRNGSDVVRWNSDKRYLGELADSGARIVPTHFGEAGRVPGLPDSDTGWVVKPTVSANAWQTRRFSQHEADACLEFATSLASEDGIEIMVQPFVPSVVEHGEWSLIFFDGEFSHAVVKSPANGDFRVQDDYGGEVRAATPSAALRMAARTAVEATPHDLLYARVDLVDYGGHPCIMELELIEPELFTRFADGAVARLADALLEGMTS